MSLTKLRPLTARQLKCVRCVSSSTVGDDEVRRKMLEKIIRVDHAGELGASYIYKGITVKKCHIVTSTTPHDHDQVR